MWFAVTSMNTSATNGKAREVRNTFFIQIVLEHSGKAYSAILSYTYSHSLDDKSSEAGVNGNTLGNGPQNEYDFAADYS
jgi:hypothetical protein